MQKKDSLQHTYLYLNANFFENVHVFLNFWFPFPLLYRILLGSGNPIFLLKYMTDCNQRKPQNNSSVLFKITLTVL